MILKLSFSIVEPPPLPLAMLLATKILQTRHQHCKGWATPEKEFQITVASCPIIFGQDCLKLCFVSNGFTTLQSKKICFMCLQMDVILSSEHILVTFVTFLLSSKKKL